MAFSPFRAFRKHQKAFFAALTIVCMLTFVLAGSMSRGGDFFSWVGSWIGASREPKVAVLYGKPIYRAEIISLRNQRRLANRYMDLLTTRAQDNFRQNLQRSPSFSKLDNWTRQQLSGGWDFPANLRGRSAQERGEYLRRLAGKITMLRGMRSFLEQKQEGEATEFKELEEEFLREFFQIQRTKAKNELFFGGTLRLDDLIDFMIWKHQADRRGIQLSTDDVKKLLARETGKNLAKSDYKEVESALREFRNLNAETLGSALADEFRVRIAKAAVLGGDVGALDQVMTAATPYEFWQFYRDQRTENLIAVLPIPVRNKEFLDQVGQPKPEELKTLYDQGKDTEYDPASDKPGFKVPPRIGVEWVSARADSEQYRKAAEIVLAATQATLPLAYQASLEDQYDREKYNHRLPFWTDDFHLPVQDGSFNRPENVAALVGQLAAGGLQPQALSGSVNYSASAAGREVQNRRLHFFLSMMSSGGSPTPFGSAALAYYGLPKSEFLPFAVLKDRLIEPVQEKTAKDLVARNLEELSNEIFKHDHQTPEQVVHDQVFYKPESIAAAIGAATTATTGGLPAVTAPNSLAPALLRANQARSRLGGEMILAGTLPTPFTAAGLVYREQNRNVEVLRGIIDRAVTRDHLQHGFSDKLRHRYDLDQDDGLKPLREAYLRFRSTDSRAPKEFTSMFWNQNIPFAQASISYSPIMWPREEIDLRSLDPNNFMQHLEALQKFSRSLWASTAQPFLYWKTEGRPPYAPTLEEANDKVLAWWKFDKARGLAEKEAEQVLAEAKGKPDAERRLKDGSKHSERWFYLTDQYDHDAVAKLVKPRLPLPGETQWKPFEFSKSQIEYPPTADIADKLIAMTEPGEVLVFHDRRKAIYYVAALAEHRVPSTWLFYHEYDIGAEPLLRELEESTHYRRDFEKNLLAQLREEGQLQIIEENRDLVDERSRSDDE